MDCPQRKPTKKYCERPLLFSSLDLSLMSGDVDDMLRMQITVRLRLKTLAARWDFQLSSWFFPHKTLQCIFQFSVCHSKNVFQTKCIKKVMNPPVTRSHQRASAACCIYQGAVSNKFTQVTEFDQYCGSDICTDFPKSVTEDAQVSHSNQDFYCCFLLAKKFAPLIFQFSCFLKSGN